MKPPFLVPRLRELREATSASFWTIVNRRIRRPEFRKAAVQFKKDFETARERARAREL